MGENNAESTLYIKSDCEWKPIGPLKTVEPLSTSGLFVEGDNAEEKVCIGKPTEFSFSPEMIPCPSRRRFVKMMMAVGVSRNRANEMAEIVVSRKENYRTGLFWCRLMAVGVSRNRANEMAEIVVSRKENYRTGLFWCRLMAVIFDAETEPQKGADNGNSR